MSDDTPSRRTSVWALVETAGRGKDRVRIDQRLDREGVLYLRWRGVTPGRTGRNWIVRSLADSLVDPSGQPLAAMLTDAKGQALVGRARQRVLDAAMREADRQYAINLGHLPDPSTTPAPVVAVVTTPALTLAAGRRRLMDPAHGRFAAHTEHNRAIMRAWNLAIVLWGPSKVISQLQPHDFVEYWRDRMAKIRATGRDGYAGARAAMVHLERALDELREGKHADGTPLLADDVALPHRKWKARLKADFEELYGDGSTPEVKRPRYTLTQLRGLLQAAPLVDPRLDLFVAVGWGLRPGQVVRARRSGVTLPPLPDPLPPYASDEAIDFGKLIIRGRGKKRGAVRHLTRAMRFAIDRALDPTTGYLRMLEADYQTRLAAGEPVSDVDYALFPAGQLLRHDPRTRSRGPVPAMVPTFGTERGKRLARSEAFQAQRRSRPLGVKVFRVLLTKAEQLAGIEHVKGLSWYGLRRQMVDAALDQNVALGPFAAIGGWENEQTPLTHYRERGRDKDAVQARSVLEQIIGPATGATGAATAAPTTDVRDMPSETPVDDVTRTRNQPVTSTPADESTTGGDSVKPLQGNDLL